MSDFLIYDLEIDTVANLGVAFGTILMAFFTCIMVYLTYRSLKSSKEQSEIQNKQLTNQEIEFGKEQITEQMKLVITPLREELIFEIDKIKSSSVNFYTAVSYKCLKFPIPTSKQFYIVSNTPEKLNGGDLPLDYAIHNLSNKYPDLATKLEKRYYIYLQIASKITNIEDELQSEGSIKITNDLVNNHFNVQEELTCIEPDIWENVVFTGKYEYDILNGNYVPT
ncbi:MAG: hypothetical protein M0P69_09055 [Bacteroidales bacterium]|nr:hypothetical protein [Bacteroidales bacterium]